MLPGTNRLAFDRGTLTLESRDASAFRVVQQRVTWVTDERTASASGEQFWRTDAMAYTRVREASDAANLPLDDNVPAWESVTWPNARLRALRPEQMSAAAEWKNRGRAGIIIMPTGTGKTEVALSLMHDLSVSTLIVAPIRDLMYQWHQRIQTTLGYNAGIIGDNTFNFRPVSVTTYDSAYIHMEKLGNRFAFVIFDECHHLPGRIRKDAARMSAAPYRLGLTATLERSDGGHEELMGLVGPVVYRMRLEEAAGQTLAEYETFKIKVHLQEDERSAYDKASEVVRKFYMAIKEEMSSFNWNEDIHALAAQRPDARLAWRAYRGKCMIEDRASEKLRILEDLFRLHAGSQTIVFTGTNHMAREISRRFLVPCILHHCRKHERTEILDGFRSGAFPVIVANEVLDEGVDLPSAKVAIVLGGHTTTRQSVQRLGRVLRRHGNEKAFLYDVFCADTNEVRRSKRRQACDAYEGISHRRI